MLGHSHVRLGSNVPLYLAEPGETKTARLNMRATGTATKKKSGLGDINPVQLMLIPGLRSSPRAKPFVKWAGGKGALLSHLRLAAAPGCRRYFEPFVGGGALFFGLRRANAFLSDSNPELINAFQVVRDNVDALIKDLRKHVHSEEYYYRLRDADRKPSFMRWSPVSRASRLIYLNKTCYNGLYRVNALGQFNVPFGKYAHPRWLDEHNLRCCSAVLQGVEIARAPFEAVLQHASAGDFVYFDPPYASESENENFSRYGSEGFGSEDQVRLRDVCVELDRRGVKVMISNSAVPLIRELYAAFRVRSVEAPRSINAKAERRGKIREVLITNY